MRLEEARDLVSGRVQRGRRSARREADVDPVITGVDASGDSRIAGRSSRSPSSSATADSPMPNVFTVRMAIGCRANRSRMRGATSSRHIWRISDGTPGMTATADAIARRPTSRARSRSGWRGSPPTGCAAPGAGCWPASARRPQTALRSISSSSGSAVSGSSRASASPSRVRSSWVGPRPPVARTSSAASRASRNACAISARSSGTERVPIGSTPSAASS